MDDEGTLPFARAVIKLLQGVVYSEDRTTWECLIQYQNEVKKYFSGIGIDAILYEADGFAFLKQKKMDEDQGPPLPGLIEKRQLGYLVTLMSVLLVERLIQFDIEGGDSSRLIVDKVEIKDSIRIFLPEISNEAKLMDRIDSAITSLVNYGFLKRLSSNENKFEVRRVLKAKIPAEGLQEIKEKLREYAKLTD